MKIEELLDDAVESDGRSCYSQDRQIVKVDAKRAIVGAGARILFYPTLLYNVFRNKIQAEFRWWDEIDQDCLAWRLLWRLEAPRWIEYLLLGAVPFPKDVPRLKLLGVGGVITLNEPYETLVSTSLYHAHGIDHLVIPTRDYLFAPSFVDINRAVDFIHKNSSCGRTTYVHCKAGRGRSTTIVLCYLVEYKQMSPADALEYVRSRRPRVLLAPSQWKAVKEYKQHRLTSTPHSPSSGDAVLITKANLEGYRSSGDEDHKKELAIVPRMARSKPMIARLSCLFASLRVSGGCGPVPRQLTERHVLAKA
ncbi:phosphatidylglycerophosphate phosphatase PTPMT2-like isoform X3 [Rhododendron vialii]|uniref:phosphatidylglycerophosphate phosphatase PTPMT2-like isoform X3 n=1 Tax=Rhododendron vialii TaxID=182163 RepID=UPI0026600941|nr:phosphatidylglycerophosphate phosphatase PTPMT2-like isoform X3 [Rhododendron vialii]